LRSSNASIVSARDVADLAQPGTPAALPELTCSTLINVDNIDRRDMMDS